MLDSHLDHLKSTKREAREVAEFVAGRPELDIPIPDFAEKAWDALRAEGKLPPSRAGIAFSPRRDDCDRPVPNAVFKVPTGGGKTWLAVSSVSRIMGRYLERNTGFVLWIVPNEAIYSQTLKHLKDRQHPYRQALDRVAAGRVKVMEKNRPTRRARHRRESERHAADAPIGEPANQKLPQDVPGPRRRTRILSRRRATSRRIRKRWTTRQTWTPIAACSRW